MQLRKAAKDCIFWLKLRKVQQISRLLEKDIEENQNDEEKIDALLKEKMLLDKAKAEIAKYFGSAII
jgi:hypothetical protein